MRNRPFNEWNRAGDILDQSLDEIDRRQHPDSQSSMQHVCTRSKGEASDVAGLGGKRGSKAAETTTGPLLSLGDDRSVRPKCDLWPPSGSTCLYIGMSWRSMGENEAMRMMERVEKKANAVVFLHSGSPFVLCLLTHCSSSNAPDESMWAANGLR